MACHVRQTEPVLRRGRSVWGVMARDQQQNLVNCVFLLLLAALMPGAAADNGGKCLDNDGNEVSARMCGRVHVGVIGRRLRKSGTEGLAHAPQVARSVHACLFFGNTHVHERVQRAWHVRHSACRGVHAACARHKSASAHRPLLRCR